MHTKQLHNVNLHKGSHGICWCLFQFMNSCVGGLGDNTGFSKENVYVAKFYRCVYLAEAEPPTLGSFFCLVSSFLSPSSSNTEKISSPKSILPRLSGTCFRNLWIGGTTCWFLQAPGQSPHNLESGARWVAIQSPHDHSSASSSQHGQVGGTLHFMSLNL